MCKMIYYKLPFLMLAKIALIFCYHESFYKTNSNSIFPLKYNKLRLRFSPLFSSITSCYLYCHIPAISPHSARTCFLCKTTKSALKEYRKIWMKRNCRIFIFSNVECLFKKSWTKNFNMKVNTRVNIMHLFDYLYRK